MNPVIVPQEKINPKELETEALPLFDWLYNFAFYFSANRRIAKRLIKRTYYKALEYFDKTRGGADYKSWMLRVMLNRIYENYSKQREAEKKNLDEEFLFNVTPFSENEIASKNESLKNSIGQKILLESITKVPVDLRLPLIFQSVLKYNYELSAEYIDIPEGVIASRIFRARKWIFNELVKNSAKDHSQKKLEYRDMKMISNIADEENLEASGSIANNFLVELAVQRMIKNFLEINLTPQKVPRMLKSKFQRKIRKMIKKRGYQ